MRKTPMRGGKSRPALDHPTSAPEREREVEGALAQTTNSQLNVTVSGGCRSPCKAANREGEVNSRDLEFEFGKVTQEDFKLG